jgi:tetratricopeptide (TPR) repeat protein
MTCSADPFGTPLLQAVRYAGCLLLVWSLGLWAGVAAAEPAGPESDVSGRSLYREASTAFRRGDYQTAADLFEQAERAGYGDPVLFYNLGVAYYRLGDLDAAEAAFATAAAYDNLAPLSCYNLGLVARRQEDYRAAHGWFHQAAAHPSASPNLKRLARKAEGSLPAVQLERPTLVAEDKARLSDFVRFSFDTGYGTDSNAYRAPKASYVDLSEPGTPTVEPAAQSGSFVPLDAAVELRWSPYEQGYFSVRYDFDGRIYTDKALENANAFANRLSVGGRVMVPKQKGYRYFSSHFVIARYDENYYDRTDGTDVLLGTTSLADRLKRTRFGPRIYYHRERGRFGYGISAEAFIAKYNGNFDPGFEYLDLTHEQYLVGAHVSYDVLEHTRFEVSYDRYRRDYTARLAKSADGVMYRGNDHLSYDYQAGGVEITQQLGRSLEASLGYRYTARDDAFEGYDDYTRHGGVAQVSFRNRRFSARAGAVYRTYDFPNAFAFDLPVAGEKTLDQLYGFFEAEFRLRPRWRILLAAELDAIDSSDPRTAYDRNQMSIGMRWRL